MVPTMSQTCRDTSEKSNGYHRKQQSQHILAPHCLLVSATLIFELISNNIWCTVVVILKECQNVTPNPNMWMKICIFADKVRWDFRVHEQSNYDPPLQWLQVGWAHPGYRLQPSGRGGPVHVVRRPDGHRPNIFHPPLGLQPRPPAVICRRGRRRRLRYTALHSGLSPSPPWPNCLGTKFPTVKVGNSANGILIPLIYITYRALVLLQSWE